LIDTVPAGHIKNNFIVIRLGMNQERYEHPGTDAQEIFSHDGGF
jgi:hypothetical protein